MSTINGNDNDGNDNGTDTNVNAKTRRRRRTRAKNKDKAATTASTSTPTPAITIVVEATKPSSGVVPKVKDGDKEDEAKQMERYQKGDTSRRVAARLAAIRRHANDHTITTMKNMTMAMAMTTMMNGTNRTDIAITAVINDYNLVGCMLPYMNISDLHQLRQCNRLFHRHAIDYVRRPAHKGGMAQRFFDRMNQVREWRPIMSAVQQFQADVAAAGVQSYITGSSVLEVITGDDHWSLPRDQWSPIPGIDLICEGNSASLTAFAAMLHTLGVARRGVRNITIDSGLRLRDAPEMNHVHTVPTKLFVARDLAVKLAQQAHTPVSYAIVAKAARMAATTATGKGSGVKPSKASSSSSSSPVKDGSTASSSSSSSSSQSSSVSLTSSPAWSSSYAKTGRRGRHDEYTSSIASQAAILRPEGLCHDYKCHICIDKFAELRRVALQQSSPSSWQLQFIADHLVYDAIWGKDATSATPLPPPKLNFAPQVAMAHLRVLRYSMDVYEPCECVGTCDCASIRSISVMFVPRADAIVSGGLFGWMDRNFDLDILVNGISSAGLRCHAPHHYYDRIAYLRTDHFCHIPRVNATYNIDPVRNKSFEGTNTSADIGYDSECNCYHYLVDQLRKYEKREYHVRWLSYVAYQSVQRRQYDALCAAIRHERHAQQQLQRYHDTVAAAPITSYVTDKIIITATKHITITTTTKIDCTGVVTKSTSTSSRPLTPADKVTAKYYQQADDDDEEQEQAKKPPPPSSSVVSTKGKHVESKNTSGNNARIMTTNGSGTTGTSEAKRSSSIPSPIQSSVPVKTTASFIAKPASSSSKSVPPPSSSSSSYVPAPSYTSRTPSTTAVPSFSSSYQPCIVEPSSPPSSGVSLLSTASLLARAEASRLAIRRSISSTTSSSKAYEPRW